MKLMEVIFMVDLGPVFWEGVFHIDPPANPSEYMETLELAGQLFREMAHRQSLRVTSVLDMTVSLQIARTVEVDLESTYAKGLKNKGKGHRRYSDPVWTKHQQRKESANGG